MNTRTWTIPSSLDQLQRLADEVCEHARVEGTGVDLFALGVVLRELVVNALRHGNQSRADIPVEIVVSTRPDQLDLEVIDQGTGFDWRAKLDQALPEPQDTGGRGLHLLKVYCTEVVFNEAGNRVRVSMRETG